MTCDGACVMRKLSMARLHWQVLAETGMWRDSDRAGVGGTCMAGDGGHILGKGGGWGRHCSLLPPPQLQGGHDDLCIVGQLHANPHSISHYCLLYQSFVTSARNTDTCLRQWVAQAGLTCSTVTSNRAVLLAFGLSINTIKECVC